MRKNLRKEDILEAFQLMESICDCNVVEYMVLKNYSISRMKVIEWLKSIGKYNDASYLSHMHCITNNLYSNEEIREDITDSKLKIYSFVDMETDFADGQFSNESYNTSYELAAEFLLNNEFCKDEQFASFMDDILFVNEGDETEEDYDYDDYIHPSESQKEEIQNMRNKILG